jgi:hypothetical protein
MIFPFIMSRLAEVPGMFALPAPRKPLLCKMAYFFMSWPQMSTFSKHLAEFHGLIPLGTQLEAKSLTHQGTDLDKQVARPSHNIDLTGNNENRQKLKNKCCKIKSK